jgi:hypothetical protein
MLVLRIRIKPTWGLIGLWPRVEVTPFMPPLVPFGTWNERLTLGGKGGFSVAPPLGLKGPPSQKSSSWYTMDRLALS